MGNTPLTPASSQPKLAYPEHIRAVSDLLLLLLRALFTSARLCKGRPYSCVHLYIPAQAHHHTLTRVLQDVSGLDSSAATADILAALRYVALALSGCPGSSHCNAAGLITLHAVHAVP